MGFWSFIWFEMKWRIEGERGITEEGREMPQNSNPIQLSLNRHCSFKLGVRLMIAKHFTSLTYVVQGLILEPGGTYQLLFLFRAFGLQVKERLKVSKRIPQFRIRFRNHTWAISEAQFKVSRVQNNNVWQSREVENHMPFGDRLAAGWGQRTVLRYLQLHSGVSFEQSLNWKVLLIWLSPWIAS